MLLALMLLPAMAFAAGAACLDGSNTSEFDQALKEHGVVFALGGAFVAGLLTSLTPCVYPMVPITVSIFGATGENTSRARGAALSGAFVLGIAALFTPMGLISAKTGAMMGQALSNVYVVCALAIVFVALASSMFGAFELALPSGVTNKLSTVGGVGYKGAFVMGLVMGLVAAPCTGPFLTGILIAIAQTQNLLLGGAALFAFAMGLGVIFFVAGAFGANLPKGGAWMMGVKWVSGVGLAYMAFSYIRDKFEVIRKLVDHPGYAFGAAAIAIFAVGVGLGLVHIVAERRKSPIAHLSKRMKLLSIVPAVAGAAMLFSWLPLNHEPEVATGDAPEITWLTSEQAALAKANAESKPVVIDFGAAWCKACKELERETFPDQAVRAEARRYIALRVDATDDEDDEIIRLRKKYDVKGLPTVIFLDKSGKEVTRFTDFVKPDKFAEALKCNANAAGKSPEAVGLNL
ncbi:MAG: thioredoxin family protein [Labilithrix sp.]|nr:thioredoxin family protein [Labilithrix sp.]MCW5810892.1 thioredoxin family protein [Labilithrix sp.]